MTLSNPSCATRTRVLSKRVRPSSATLAVLSSERKEENDGQMGSRPINGGRRPILARPHVVRRRGRHWHCEVCDKRLSGGAEKAKLARTECVGHPATALGARETQCHLLAQTGSFVYGAAGVEREQPSS